MRLDQETRQGILKENQLSIETECEDFQESVPWMFTSPVKLRAAKFMVGFVETPSQTINSMQPVLRVLRCN
jgi:hypothetical protein